MSEPTLLDELNERELEIIPLLAEGLSNREIANRLFLAPNTVKWYVRQLNSKLDTTNRDEIVERAEKVGLLHVEKTEESYVRPRQNIPRQTTPFIGRDAELDEIHSLLENPDVRLLTILAQGGMGKTRLALEALEQQINNFPDGVYFIPLQSLDTPDQIIPAIAEHIYFQFQPGERSPEAQILAFLSKRQMLLCIDNWEHLIEAAPLVNTILKEAPQVKIIATSREKLNLLGETLYVLRGMQFPSWETPEDALAYDAVQLLVQAAQRVQPDWQVTTENLDYVARVCRLTQGMPLGILLAMSWVNMLSIRQIADEIKQSLDFLETDLRDVPERQQSIRAIFNHAWDKLSPSEQAVFMKLSIFRGGFTFEAAREVAGASIRILHRLIEKALVLKQENERFDLHELLRQYGEEKLRESGQYAETERIYCHFYMNWCEAHILLLRQLDLETIEQFQLEMINLESAWQIAIVNRDEEALLAGNRLRFAFNQFGLRHRAVEMWRAALDVVTEANVILYAKLLIGMASLMRFERHKRHIAHKYAEKVVELLEDTTEYYTYFNACIGVLSTQELTADRLIPLLHARLDEIRRVDEIHRSSVENLQLLEMHILYLLSIDYSIIRELEQAEQYGLQSMAIAQELNDMHGMLYASDALGSIYMLQHNRAKARPYFDQRMKIVQARRHISGQFISLIDLFFLELADGNMAEAARVFEQAQRLQTESGMLDFDEWFTNALMVFDIYQGNFDPVFPFLRNKLSASLDTPLRDMWLRHFVELFLKCGKDVEAMMILGFHDASVVYTRHLLHMAMIDHKIADIRNLPEYQSAYEEGKTMDWQTVRQLLEQTLNEVE